MKHKNFTLGLVIGISFFLALWFQLPKIADPYTFKEDFRYLFWVNLYEDNSL